MSDTAQNAAATETIAGPFTSEMIVDTFGPDAVMPESASAAESAPKDEPAKEEPKVSDRIAAAMKAEKRAQQERENLRLKEKEISDRESALKPTAEDIRLFEEDPAKFIAKKGWTQKQVGEFLDKLAGNVQPEAVNEKKLTEQDQRIKELEDKLAAKEHAEESAKLSAQHQQAQEEAGKVFIEHIVSAVDKYPHLTEVYANDAEVVAAGFAVLTQIIGRDRDGKPVSRVQAFEAQHGRGPTDQELAEHLDSLAKAKIEARTTASWRKGVTTNQARQAASGESKEVPPVKGTSPRTLSRADTSQRAAAPRNADWSQEKADEESLAIFSKAMKR